MVLDIISSAHEKRRKETKFLDAVDHVLGIADAFPAECITNCVGYHHNEDANPHSESSLPG